MFVLDHLDKVILIEKRKYKAVIHVHPKLPNYPFSPATISSFSKSVSLFLFRKFICIISF